MREESRHVPLSKEEQDAMDHLDEQMRRLLWIGVFILILSWAAIGLVLIGIALNVPGNLFQAH
jgi:hypothetical protein